MGAALLAGCGYPGDPLPPALNRPVRVADLKAVQRGAKVYVQFTVPSTTTENLALHGKPDIELRMGPAPAGEFSLSAWEKSAARAADSEIHLDSLPVPGVPKRQKRNAPAPPTERYSASAQLDASKFYGKTVLVGVRVHGRNGQDVGWSRLEKLELVAALPVPEGLAASNAPDAIRLDWHAAAPEFRIFRKAPADIAFRQVGTSEKPFYLDTTIDYGKSYEYLVQSVEKTGDGYAESEPSGSVSFRPVDTFPPAVPVGLTPVPGARSIELVWERNAEKDFASYTVVRDGKKVAEGLSSPSYSDRDVKAGTRYRYQVSATDTAGNTSALSAPVETAIP
jgi:hypothetical protein